MQTAFYQMNIFGRGLIKRGAFIEDRIGTLMLSELRAQGRGAHARWGTWLVDDGLQVPMVRHLDGRGLLLPGEKEERRQAGQARRRRAQEHRKQEASEDASASSYDIDSLFDSEVAR